MRGAQTLTTDVRTCAPVSLSVARGQGPATGLRDPPAERGRSAGLLPLGGARENGDAPA